MDTQAQETPAPPTPEQAVVQIFEILMQFGGRVSTHAVPGYVFVQGHHGAPVAVRTRLDSDRTRSIAQPRTA